MARGVAHAARGVLGDLGILSAEEDGLGEVEREGEREGAGRRGVGIGR